eukprot:4448083-Amphidinium_carterae.2
MQRFTPQGVFHAEADVDVVLKLWCDSWQSWGSCTMWMSVGAVWDMAFCCGPSSSSDSHLRGVNKVPLFDIIAESSGRHPFPLTTAATTARRGNIDIHGGNNKFGGPFFRLVASNLVDPFPLVCKPRPQIHVEIGATQGFAHRVLEALTNSPV